MAILRLMRRALAFATALAALPAAARGQALVSPVVATSIIPDSNIDSTAVWVDPNGVASPLLFITQKDGDRVEVRSALTGVLDPRTPFLGGIPNSPAPGQFDRPNGVWVIYHVPVGGRFADILLVTDQQNERVQAFHMPDLAYFGEFGNREILKGYGIAWYQDGTDFHVFITDNFTSTGKVKKYRLLDLGDRIGGTLELVFGQSSGTGSLANVESILVDPFHRRLHICGDEGGDFNRIYDLDGNYTGTTYGDPQFERDPEGINLYDLGGGRGYIVISDQYTTAANEFEVFDRATIAPLGNFKSRPGGLITSNTDGAYLEQRPLPGFPNGAFYPVNDDENVHIYDWTDIAQAMNLEIAALDRPFPAAAQGASTPARSALWFHDGSWWAIVPQASGQAIARLEDGTFAVQTQLGGDRGAAASVAADGDGLAVLLSTGEADAELHRFAYEPSGRRYTTVGEPTAISGTAGGIADFERDGTGRGWIALSALGEARMRWSAAADLSVGEGAAVLGPSNEAAPRLVRLDGAVGALWASPAGVAFRFHRDADPPGDWSALETVASAAVEALAIAPDGSGGAIAAGSAAAGEGWVWLRAAALGWRELALSGSGNRDPALAVDLAVGQAHLLTRAQVAGRWQLMRREAALGALAPGGAGFGAPSALLAWPGVDMGPALVARRPGNAASGVVAASIGSDGLGRFARLAWPAAPDRTPPITLQHSPEPGAAGIAPDARICFRIVDDLDGVDLAALRVLVNGQAVARTVRGVRRNYLIEAAIPVGAGPDVAVRIEAADRASPANPMAPFEHSFRLADVPETFRRGDPNGSGAIDVSDAVFVLFGLFAGLSIPCADAADADDDGSLATSDAVFVLSYLFRDGEAPRAPSGSCGGDPTADELNCGDTACP